MALAFGAMAGGFAAAAMAEGERTRQQVFGEVELAEDGELPLPPAGGFGAFGFGVHLNTIMYSEESKIKHLFRTRK